MVAHLATNAVEGILDHLSDVIEGSNAYASGTEFDGIPGRVSNNAGLMLDGDGSVTASDDGDTTTLPYASGSWNSSRWVKEETPGFFAVCLTATNIGNVGAARRITGWDDTGKEFTVDAFPAAISNTDTFSILQGFKRFPDGIDHENEETETQAGWDRFFSWEINGEGTEVPFYGKGLATLSTIVTLQLRIEKHARDRRATGSALANMAILRRGLLVPNNHSGTLIRALLPEGGSEIVSDTIKKVVIRQDFTLHYRIETTQL